MACHPISPPCSTKAYFQETRRAGRDGKHAKALLYYNNHDIAKNKMEMTDEMRPFCKSKSCLRIQMLHALDFDNSYPIQPAHLCCNMCAKKCSCEECHCSASLVGPKTLKMDKRK